MMDKEAKQNIIDGFQGVKNHLETIMGHLADQSKSRQGLTDDEIITSLKIVKEKLESLYDEVQYNCF